MIPISDPEAYFSRNYVHPATWRDVINKFPDLKLCLAHFGGGEWDNKKGFQDSNWINEIISLTRNKNVYTDISCWDLGKNNKKNFRDALRQYPHLKDHIIFGTDWYMILLDNVWGKGYSKFCQEFWDFFMDEDFPEGKELWQRFTFINPFKFYGLNSLSKVNNLISALNANKAKTAVINKNKPTLLRLVNDFDKICSKIQSGG